MLSSKDKVKSSAGTRVIRRVGSENKKETMKTVFTFSPFCLELFQ